MNAQEILEIIKNNYRESSYAHDYWTDPEPDSEASSLISKYKEAGLPYSEQHSQITKDLGLGEVKEVYQRGGEGEGDYWTSVKYFVDHDVYLKIDGSYTSYNGTEFYEGYGYEVKPREETITVYN